MTLFHHNGPCPKGCGGTLTETEKRDLETVCGLSGFVYKQVFTCDTCNFRIEIPRENGDE